MLFQAQNSEGKKREKEQWEWREGKKEKIIMNFKNYTFDYRSSIISKKSF